MKSFDEMIGEVRKALASSSPEWGAIKTEIAKHPDKELLQYYLRKHGKHPHLEGGDRKTFIIRETAFPMRWVPPAVVFLMHCDPHPFWWRVTITRGFWMMERVLTHHQIIEINPLLAYETIGGDGKWFGLWEHIVGISNTLSLCEDLPVCFGNTIAHGRREWAGIGNGEVDYLHAGGWRLPSEAEWAYAAVCGRVYGQDTKMQKTNKWGLSYDAEDGEVTYDEYESSHIDHISLTAEDPCKAPSFNVPRVVRGYGSPVSRTSSYDVSDERVRLVRGEENLPETRLTGRYGMRNE